jgi:hypothetical protein
MNWNSTLSGLTLRFLTRSYPGQARGLANPYMLFVMHRITDGPSAAKLALGGAPQLRPFTEASVASRSERAQQRSAGDTIRRFGLDIFVFLCFLLRQESQTGAPAYGAAVARASSFNPRTVLHQSVAQLEPPAPDAQNSNRCLSDGLGRQLVFVRLS